MLYPTEEVQGMIGYSGASGEENIFPIIDVNRNTYKDYEISNRTIPLQILRDLSKFYKVSSDYFFEDMPELIEKEQSQLFRYSTAVANDKKICSIRFN